MSPSDSVLLQPDSARLAVGILLLDHFQISAFGCLRDTLNLPEKFDGDDRRDRLSIMSPTGQPALAMGGLEIAAHDALLWPEAFDYIVVMGSLSARLWRWSNTVSRYLRSADRLGVTLVGVGDKGVATLARFKLLDGYAACATPTECAVLQEQFPQVGFRPDRIFLEDRKRITSLEGTVTADLAAFLLQRHKGEQAARQACTTMGLSGRRAPETPPPVASAFGRLHNPLLQRAIGLMTANIAKPTPVDSLAARLGLSRRQLDRICEAETAETAKGLWLQIRLREAARLLVQSHGSLSEIAWATGFTDAPHLSRSLRRVLQINVSQLRRAKGLPGAHGPET